MAECIFDVESPPDVCGESSSELINAVFYTHPEKPIEYLPLPNGKTAKQAISEEFARRLALTDSDDEKIYQLDVKQAEMPFGTPAYKTNPHTKQKVEDVSNTEMKFTGTDYRNNDEVHDYWAGINGKMVLAWGLADKKLIGGAEGLLGSFSSTRGIINGAEMPAQTKWEYIWAGSASPKSVSIV